MSGSGAARNTAIGAPPQPTPDAHDEQNESHSVDVSVEITPRPEPAPGPDAFLGLIWLLLLLRHLLAALKKKLRRP